MNYTYCETLMWHALASAAFRGKAKTAFTLKAQQNRAAVAARTDAKSSPFHWDTEVILGRDVERRTAEEGKL